MRQNTDGMRPVVTQVLITVGFFPVAASLLAWLGMLWWPLDLFSHFVVQYAVSLTVVSLGLFLVRARRPALIFGLFAAAHLLTLARSYISPHAGPRGTVSRFRIASINVNTANTRADRVLAFIAESNPDIVLVTETDARWLNDLDGLAAQYPHKLSLPRPDNFGIALYSKLPCPTCKVVVFGGRGLPSVIGTFVLPNQRTFALVGTHPLPPVSRRGAAARNEQLRAIGDALRLQHGPKVVVGDLNSSPWSHAFGRLLKAARLRDSSAGHGLHATWPAQVWWLRIPLDHILVSPEFGVTRKLLGPDIGSDHLPVVVDLVL